MPKTPLIIRAEPAGKNPAGDERYQELRVEVDKENSPTGEAVRWPRVAQVPVRRGVALAPCSPYFRSMCWM